jgi:hypothetical protein
MTATLTGCVVIVGEGVVTVKFAPLLATAPTVTTTLPVVAPAGTGATKPVGLQPVAVVATPLNFTVLAPCVAPKFAPETETDVVTGPEVGLKLEILGLVLPPPDALKAAIPAPQISDVASDAPAEAVPAASCMPPSVNNLVFGSAGTRSPIAKLLPAVQLPALADRMAPSTRSPAAVVTAFPLLGSVLFPCAAAVVSSEFVEAIPEYSRIAKRRVRRMVSETVMVLAPAAMFSA